MVRCEICVMPDTRPGAIFKNGVCQACRNYKKAQKTDWDNRWLDFQNLCDFHRSADGYYDCIVPVSGGKDSHFVAATLRQLSMHPLMVCVTDPFTHTKAGLHNLNNLRQFGDVHIIDIRTTVKATKIAFEETGEALKFLESAIYLAPTKLAAELNIPLVVFGENSAFLYGSDTKDSSSVKGVLVTGDSSLGAKGQNRLLTYWHDRGLTGYELNSIRVTKPLGFLDPVFMSYYVPWDDEHNFEIAKQHGFQTLHDEWDREGCVEDYCQIDSFGYMVHLWLKYPALGFSRTSDIVSRWVRKGKITREEAMRLVREKDHKLDQRALNDFCSTLGYTHRQFWEIVEKHWNRELFEKWEGVWRAKF